MLNLRIIMDIRRYKRLFVWACFRVRRRATNWHSLAMRIWVAKRL